MHGQKNIKLRKNLYMFITFPKILRLLAHINKTLENESSEYLNFI